MLSFGDMEKPTLAYLDIAKETEFVLAFNHSCPRARW
jgi:hypothetical protein